MPGHQHRRLPWLVAAVTLAFLAVGTSPAAAHTHPTPIERASPGVVYIEARAKVEVALIEHRQAGDSFGVHIGIIQSSWNPVLGTASGFVVDPTGAIVTTGAITQLDLDRARVFAVNQAFHKRYGDAAPLPQDPFSRNRLGDSGDRNEERLKACYPPNTTNDAGGCVVRVTPDYVVYPYVTSQQRYGGLHAEVLPGGTPDVAVLRVRGANSMPTVAVGSSTAGAEALGVLGFTAIPGADHRLQEINQHLATKGGSTLKTTGLDAGDVREAARLATALRNGMAGGPVLAERGQVVGLLPSAPRPGSGAPALVSIASVLPVLAKAGVSPHGGPVDGSFEAAMHLFKNNGYAASIAGFSKALELFPGHFLASTNLVIAKQHVAAGTSASGPGGTGSQGTTSGASAAAAASAGTSGWWWGLAAVALLAAAAVLFLLWRRRRTAVAAVAGPGGSTSGGHRSPPGGRGGPGAGGSGGTGGPPRPAGAAGGAAAAAAGASGVAPRPGPTGPSGPTGPARPDGSRAPGGAAPARPGVGPVPRPNASSAAPSVAAARPAGGDRAGAGRAPAPGRAPAAGSTPAPAAGPAPASAPGHGAVPHDPVQASRAAQESAPRFCTSCGGRLAARHQFCGWCGEPVG
jgi:hypothetical protein